MLKVTILGCGASVGVPSLKYGWGNCDPTNAKNYRTRSSIIIQTAETTMLVDMTPDLRQQLLNFGSSDMDGVFITHEHYDHVSGINELRPVAFGNRKNIDIYSSKVIIDNIKKMFYYLFEDNSAEIYKPYISTHDICDEFSINDISCTCFEQSHGYSKSLGIRIGNFAYCTDVIEFSDKSFAKLDGLDTWIIGCLSYEKRPTHANLDTVLEWVHKLKPKKTILTHMGAALDYETLIKKLPENVIPAYDGMEIITM